jgi:hypothetical protein
MSALDSKLRSQLDCVCQKARDRAEEAARSALQKRAVDAAEPYPHFTAPERKLRNRLRARGRQAGDVRQANKTQGIEQLAQELAYEYWHRMLFARFLAENHLLMHPDGVAVSLEECEELAKSEGASNGFALAARYASKMLPQVFRTDDVLLEIEFAPEHRLALEKLLASLPKPTFLADDSLGWVYQFWQSKKKEDVNKSDQKIDARTLPAVTQLFTEHYMVQFLLHNTIGAWWCATHGVQGPPSGAGVPAGHAPVEMEYLRWNQDGAPAAGVFDGWPRSLKQVKLLDPCCGSGHFLVAAFNFLVPLRMNEEGLNAREACDAVLRENIFGLELDPRCTQIAAFALAVAAWKYVDEDGQPCGYRELPPLNIACTGIGPQAGEDEWLKLAEQSGKSMSALSREPILNGLRNLHALFSNAPTLGSLIDPSRLSADLISADYETLQPYLAAALTAEQGDDDAHERAVAAAGMVKAAELLAGEYTLVTTNVPYLGRIRQDEILRRYCDANHAEARLDLATCFVERCLSLSARKCTTALVTMQNCLFLARYEKFRRALLASATWNLAAKLGPKGFQTPMWDFGVALLVLTNQQAPADSYFAGIELVNANSPAEKAAQLRVAEVRSAKQTDQFRNPDAAIVFEAPSHLEPLSRYADSYQGASTVEIERFRMYFWEVEMSADWNYHQSTPSGGRLYSGLEFVSIHRRPGGEFHKAAEALKAEGRLGGAYSGQPVWGKTGVACSWMGSLPAAIYLGTVYDNSVAAIVPHNPLHLLPIWCFCSSPQFLTEVRKINQKTQVANATLVKVPFDLSYWQTVAAEEYPGGLPEPESDDPTQWLFHGRPEASTSLLEVAVARLLGYRWPAELDSTVRLSKRARDLVRACDALLPLGDKDGIVCLPAVRTEPPAVERLLEIVRVVSGPKWSNSLLHDLLVEAECKPGATLDEWLRNTFFDEHCKLFQHRPFIWHIWDGRKDGFSCLVNYHKLNYKTLDNLTHSYLESWIKKQAGDAKTGKAGADLRLAAAQALQEKLKLILVGEPSYDIFVRWKPLCEQPIGWNPDLNDGVRVNIRPFVEAGVLRKNPNLKWTKDRGREPQRDRDDYPWFWKGKEFVGDRVNDVHLTNAEKQAAREAKGMK